jgi:hypothetical protein
MANRMARKLNLVQRVVAATSVVVIFLSYVALRVSGVITEERETLLEEAKGAWHMFRNALRGGALNL